VKEITGQSFSTEQEYGKWFSTGFEQLPVEKKRQLSKAFNEWIDVDKTRPSLIVRFRDFREIAPGIWWPFREDRAQGYSAKEGFDCMRSDYVVDEVRTDADLSDTVKALLPQEGEQVQDQRYAAPVNYDFRADRNEDDILKLVDIEYQKLLRGKEALNRWKQPVEALVGKPAPTLPEQGWIGGPRPDLKGKPFLIHFWATWCGPCKNDLPILKRMAADGFPIIGMHPAGTPASEIVEVMKEFELGYPTFVESTMDSRLSGRKIAGYPADIFPYCILVDHQGSVAGHGRLREPELIKKLRELQKTAAGK
jgi:thiol-disulfide isomerase/thioredoxin